MIVDREERSRLPSAERIRLVEQIYIHYPRLGHIEEKVEQCHRHSRVAAEPECLLITGQTGAGKTTVCRNYARKYPRAVTRDGVLVPVLATSIPVPATPKSLVTKLLFAIGDPAAAKGTLVTQTLRLVKLMADCGVELVILDEFQHFIDRDSNSILLTVANLLKDILNETECPMVLMGLPYSDVVLRANDQLERRFSMRAALDPFGWRSAEQQAEFRTFLHYLDDLLPLGDRSHLSDTEMALRIYCAAAGVIGYVMKLVRRAAALAIERKMDRLDLELLVEVYEERLRARAPDRANPFRADPAELTAEALSGHEAAGVVMSRRLKGAGRRGHHPRASAASEVGKLRP